MKDRVIKARQDLHVIEREYRRIKTQYDRAVTEFHTAVRELEDHDYQQALVDGRTKRYPMGYSAKDPVEAIRKMPKESVVNILNAVAEKFGITLDDKEDKKDEEGTGVSTDKTSQE